LGFKFLDGTLHLQYSVVNRSYFGGAGIVHEFDDLALYHDKLSVTGKILDNDLNVFAGQLSFAGLLGKAEVGEL